MDWFYFMLYWEAFYKRFRELFAEEIEIYEINQELDEIEAEFEALGI